MPREGQPLEQNDYRRNKGKAAGQEEESSRRHYDCNFRLDWPGQQVIVSIIV
jgi:hypothetical protein